MVTTCAQHHARIHEIELFGVRVLHIKSLTRGVEHIEFLLLVTIGSGTIIYSKAFGGVSQTDCGLFVQRPLHGMLTFPSSVDNDLLF